MSDVTVIMADSSINHVLKEFKITDTVNCISDDIMKLLSLGDDSDFDDYYTKL
jgi:hypothetical protein